MAPAEASTPNDDQVTGSIDTTDNLSGVTGTWTRIWRSSND
jgi:hypothetical protein